MAPRKEREEDLKTRTFAFHRMDLLFMCQQSRIMNREPEPVIKYYEFTLEDIKRMDRVAKPKERYVLLVGR